MAPLRFPNFSGGAMRILGCLIMTLLTSLPVWGAVLNHQGVLTDPNGAPINGSVQIGFRVYDGAEAVTPIWEEINTVTVEDGFYSTSLGVVTPIEDDIFLTH